MGQCSSQSPEVAEQLRKNKALEKQLAHAQQKDASKIKLLLLGAGECGKSTFFKQIGMLYGKPWSHTERMNFRRIIHANTIQAMKIIIEDGVFGLCLDCDENLKKDVNMFLKIPDHNVVDETVSVHVVRLWTHPVIQEAFSMRAKYQLFDSADYFFENVDRLSAPDYLPTNQDILRSRVRTTGIIEESYVIEGKEFVVIDVGGQRNERKKWIHCFEDVTAIVFIAALSAYDSMLFEDNSTNRMYEALDLFDSVINSPWFAKTDIILFLNKDDLFSEKIKKISLKRPDLNWFMDYEGGTDASKAYDYIRDKFMERKQSAEKVVYDHRTTATDEKNMEKVFKNVRETILNSNMAAMDDL